MSQVLKPKGRRKASEGPKITFKTPAGSSTERLRFKKGDGVLLSRTHPMTDMLADGNVLDVREGSVVIGLTESADGGAEGGGAGSGGGGGGCLTILRRVSGDWTSLRTKRATCVSWRRW